MQKFTKFLCILLATLLPQFLEQAIAESEAASLPKNVVVIVIDTLRADHLPFYGYKRNTANFLNHLSEKAVVFENAISTASYTAPATASILTSLLPEQHGVLLGKKASRKVNKITGEDKINRIPKAAITMAEYFKRLGYETYGIADNGNISKKMGFAQGFDKFSTFNNKGADKVHAQFLKWSSDIKQAERLFLYLHYMDPHGPFLKRERWYNEKDESKENAVVRAYNSEIGYVDHYIEKVFQNLTLDKDSIVVVTSDHGEEFWDHGKQGHGKTLYNEVLQVPLLFYAPGRLSPTRFAPAVSIVDIFPTLVELVGHMGIDAHAGISLLSALQENKQDDTRPIVSTLFRKLKNGRKIEMRAVTQDSKRASRREDGSWKKPAKQVTIKKKLFDLETDPVEKSNLAKQRPQLFEELLEEYGPVHKRGSTFEREFAS